MKLRVLVDNNTFINEYYYGEPGACYYIEDEDKTLLLDTGYSDVFLRNAKAMGIDINKVDVFAFSHGHDDHTGGVKYLLKELDMSHKTIAAHPNAFLPKKSHSGMYNGAPVSYEDLKGRCSILLTRKPVQLSPHITFLGEIPRICEFEEKKPCGSYFNGQSWVEDYMQDDTALAYHCSDGMFIITGCSHSGICNIIEYAKKVCNDGRILGVIGGFHLLQKSYKTDKTIEYLKENHIKTLYPCHCISLQVKAQMINEMEINEVGVGLEINLS
jgi:7,8-dihydropterin-6-yl-methyl-4-(beta-D-ribofuranosyl)aminobenzene 5'-phosphate synthase